MRRLLMICYHFPPLGGIASLRALRFARHLPEFGWEPVVVTPSRAQGPGDPSLAFDPSKIVSSVNFEWSGLGARLSGGPPAAHGAPGVGLRGRLRAFARRWLYFPDGQIGWYPGALIAARRVMRHRRVDLLYSSAYPMTGHLVARRLCRDSGLPWVADFRDLWSEWSQETPLRRARELALETSILAEASAVTTVSPTYVERLQARGARRVELLTNGYDHEGAPPVGPLPPVVAYLGTFYPDYQDHVITVLEALGRLRREGPRRDIRLRFIGPFPHSLRSILERHGLSDVSDATGFLPQAQAIAELERAGVLLVAGPAHARTPEVRGNVAAKTFEYLAAHRPILMVGDPDSDLARMLRPFARACIVAPGQVEVAMQALLHLLDWQAGPEPSIAEYHSRNLSARLARLCDELVAHD